MLRRYLKAVHEIGAAGYVGALAACVVTRFAVPIDSPVAYAAASETVSAIARYLIVPSLFMSIVSGLLALAANDAYLDAGWAWSKALLGLVMFEGTLATIAAAARQTARLSALAVAGQGDPAALGQALRAERHGSWLMLALATANIVLAVWRPRFHRAAA